MTFEDGLQAVQRRGEAMQAASDAPSQRDGDGDRLAF
jgi:hypothetical protein